MQDRDAALLNYAANCPVIALAYPVAPMPVACGVMQLSSDDRYAAHRRTEGHCSRVVATDNPEEIAQYAISSGLSESERIKVIQST